MTNDKRIHAIIRVAILSGAAALTGCPGDDTSGTGGSSDTTAGSAETVNPEGSTTVQMTTTPMTESSSSTSVNPDSTSGGDDPFIFPTDPYDAYTQIDRHGAVEAGTAGILASQGLGFGPMPDIALRDAYNASNPAEDEAGMWLNDITDSVMFFHMALDDDIGAFMLDAATVNEALAQAAPVLVPDTIKYDPAEATGYPNGRNLQDQVVDITFAAVLLDLNTHALDTLASVPINPPANDVEFGAEFPYLAPPF
jgi:hypothetical protein